MKIVAIFAEKLFSFHYESEQLDEYGRLFDVWNDPEYLYEFAEKYEQDIQLLGYTIDTFVECILEESELLESLLLMFKDDGNNIDRCFQPLHNQEYQQKILSLQKKKCKHLRLYAIRIDADCFVITGGAIKLKRTMQEHPETHNELEKLNRCKHYLQLKGVFDNDSFYEIIGE